MDWVKWAIPLIVLAVWILANLARVPREMPPPVRRPGVPPDRDQPPGANRVPITDVDRFLEEVRRRQQAKEQRPPEPAQPIPEVLPVAPRRRVSMTDEPPEARAPVPVRPAARPAQSDGRRRPKPTGTTRPALAEATPVTPSKRLVDNTEFPGLAPEAAQPTFAPDAAQPTFSPTAAVGTAAVVAQAPLARSAAQVIALLRDPQSVRTAILLREILDAPLCRRGRHRPGASA